MTIIRDATIYDHTGICRCLDLWLQEPSVIFPPGNRALSSWVNGVLTAGYCLVAEDEGKIVGVLGASICTFPWNDTVQFLNEDFFFVVGGYRKGGTALKMINAIIAFAKERQIILKMDVMCDKDFAKKDRFFRMKGLVHLGGNFIFGLAPK